MTLRTYIIFAVVAFSVLTGWLWENPFTEIGWLRALSVVYIAVGLIIALGFIYTIARLLWAIIRRLEQ